MRLTCFPTGKSVSWHGFHDPAHGVELYGGIVEQPLDMPAADHFGGRQTVKDGRIDKGYSVTQREGYIQFVSGEQNAFASACANRASREHNS